jgi:flagellar biosynthetic protein FlhB
MESSSQDRNLPASARKLQKAREEGQVPRSRDFGHLAVLGGGGLTLAALAPWGFELLQAAFSQQLAFDAALTRSPAAMLERLQAMTVPALAVCVGFALIVSTLAVLGTVLTGGWVATLKPVLPDLSRLNPLKGLAGLFSKKKLAEVVKISFIAFFILALGAAFIHATLPAVAALVLQPSARALQQMMGWMVGGGALLLAVVLLVALVDVPLQIFLYRAELRMSRQEIKDEGKEIEGNPQIKGRIRSRQREIAQRSSVRKVPQADFIVTNPTHYAVAVKYDDKTMAAPRVIAKGADLLAFKIRDLGRAHEVPVLQSPVLARALYAHAELDQDIPAALYTAVAQVLAYVYRLKAALRDEGPMPGEPPQPEVPAALDPLQSRAAAARA